MRNYNLVAALAIFKMDVYSNSASKDNIKNYLLNTLGLSVWSGQKRLVVFDPNNNSVVYKIAYSTQGIVDNIHEVACSERLQELVSQGAITADDASLFGKARLVDGDPFIIEMNAATNFVQDPDFVQWFNQNRKGDLNENQMFPLYVASNPNLAAQANRQQKILSDFFKPSDVTIFKEPKNFCFTTDSMGNKKLVLIDLGSVCPNLVRNGQLVKIPCAKCGCGERTYVAYEISASLTQNSAYELEGTYLCKNPNCSDYYGKALSKTVDYLSKDSFVYAKFLQDNMDLVRVMRAQYGLSFTPDREVSTKLEYMQEMSRTLGVTPNDQILNVMYRNYLSVACGFLTSQFGYEISNIPYITPNNTLITFNDYLNHFNNVMMRNQHPINDVTKRTAALHYLSLLASTSNEIGVYYALTSPDYNTFASTISSKFGVDQYNGNNIFNCLQSR